MCTKVLNWRLVSYVEVNNMFYEEQAGYRLVYSTIDYIFILQSVESNKRLGITLILRLHRSGTLAKDVSIAFYLSFFLFVSLLF